MSGYGVVFSFEKRCDEFFCWARIDRVSESAQLTHTAGYFMIQQTKSGFNSPGFAVGANDPAGGIIAALFSGNSAPSISGGICPIINSATCSKPGGLELPPPDRRPLFVEAVIALRLLRFRVRGVGQSSPGVDGDKPEPVTPVVRTRARGFHRQAPHGVAQGTQITSHKSEPFRRARNLLSKDDCRVALADKLSPDRPEVAVVVEAFLITGEAEGLAGARASPNRSIVSPTGRPEGVRPSANPGEEVALRVGPKVIGSDINNTPGVYVAGSYEPARDQCAEPVRSKRLDFVVISGHAAALAGRSLTGVSAWFRRLRLGNRA